MGVTTLQMVNISTDKINVVEKTRGAVANLVSAGMVIGMQNQSSIDAEFGDLIPGHCDYALYIQFNLAGITGTVNSAILSFKRRYAGTAKEFNVKAVTSAWDKTTIKSTLLPTNEATAYSSHTTGTATSGIESFDITNIVSRMVAGTLVNNGFRISSDSLYVAYSDTTTEANGWQNYWLPAAGTDGPKLVIDAGVSTVSITATMASISTVSASFNVIPPRLILTNVIILSNCTVKDVVFAGFISALSISLPTAQSTSQFLVTIFNLTAVLFSNSPMNSTSNLQLTISVVLPSYFLLRGNVAIGGVSVTGATVRVVSNDGTQVFTTTTDSSGNYEVQVNTSGIYHLMCYKKDVDSSIYSSVCQPFINVVAS